MNIAFITDSIRPDITGVGIYSRSLIKLFMNEKSHFKYSFVDYEKTKFNQKRIILINRGGLFSKISLWYCSIAFELKKHNYDLIFNCTGVPHIIPFVQKEVFIFHDSHAVLYPEFTSKKTHIYNMLLLKWSLRNAFKIIVNSIQTEKELITYFKIPPNKIFRIYVPDFYIPNDLGMKKSILSITRPYLLSMCTVDIRKNIQNLIMAFEYFKSKFNDKYKLVIAGKPGFGYQKIKTYINQSIFKKDIILTGYVNDTTKYFLLKRSAVLVYVPYYEGLGIPILEAAYHNISIVASDIPSMREVLNNTQFVQPDNYIGIARKIQKISTNVSLKKRLIKLNAQKINKLFNPDYIKTKFYNLLLFLNITE